MSTPQVVVSRIQNRRGTQAEFDALASPKLQPGEIGLITDTQIVYIGNEFGELLELYPQVNITNLIFTPLVIALVPETDPTVITALSFTPTPFLDILYSVTNATSDIINTVGITFAQNGTLSITAVAPTIAQSVLLNDTNVSLNQTIYSINFTAQYSDDSSVIQVLYNHNFPGTLYFNTGTIQWVNPS